MFDILNHKVRFEVQYQTKNDYEQNHHPHDRSHDAVFWPTG